MPYGWGCHQENRQEVSYQHMKYLAILLLLLATKVTGDDNQQLAGATLVEVIEQSATLSDSLYKALRGLKYPHTINTDDVLPDAELLKELTQRFLRWKSALETALSAASADETAAIDNQRKEYLISLYFNLLTNLMQAKKIIARRLDWVNTGSQYALTVPLTLAWSRSQTLQKLFAQQVEVSLAAEEGQARLQLRDAYVDGIQIAALASHAKSSNHFAAVKYLIYLTLYRQLVQNEHYRGTQAQHVPLLTLANTDYDLELRERIIAYQRRDRADQYMQAALLETLPRLQVPAAGLQQPLLANWPLYEQLQAAHPDMQAFTTPLLAQQLFTLLNEAQRQAIAVNDAEEMRRFMLLVEHLYLQPMLQRELPRNPLNLDASDASQQALQQILVQARFSALINGLAQLRIKRDKLQGLLDTLQERQQTMLASDKQQIARWYEAAQKLLPELRQRLRTSLLRELLYVAWKVDTAERDGNAPLNLEVLRKALLRSMFVTDFTGEFQQSLAAIMQARGYAQSRTVFFNELAKHLQRLTPQRAPQAQVLSTASQDDIVRTYINPVMAAERTLDSDAAHAVQRKTTLHHIAQTKALLQHGYWFGYFTHKGDAMPSLDDLPLTDLQRANYYRELRFARFDLYPFLLLPVEASKDKLSTAEGEATATYVAKKQPLYQVLAAKLHGRDLSTVDEEEINNYWPLVAEVLDTQRQRIIAALHKIDKADALQDIKHLAANSSVVAMGMKEFAVLYPQHEKFAHRYSKPSKLQHSWERIDFTYIGNFFTIIIGWHLGSWLLRKSVTTSYLLRYLTPTFGAILPHTSALMMGLWYVILVDYFGIKVWQTFVSKPRKVHTLRQYYYLGNQQNHFVTSTYLDYLDMEKKSHFLNYGFEAAMFGLFIGWWGYNHLLPHLLPNLRNTRLQRLFYRVGFRNRKGQPLEQEEMYKRRHELFDRTEINASVKKEIAKVQEALQAGRISKRYAKQQEHQIKLSRDKIFTSMNKKERAISVADIEHAHDFRALGLAETTFKEQEIDAAYNDLRGMYLQRKGLLSHFAMRDAEVAILNLQMSLMRRLKFQMIRPRGEERAKIRELSAELREELALFGIRPNRKDTFTKAQLDKAQAQINRRFPLDQQVDSNLAYVRFESAYNRLHRAEEEMGNFKLIDGWHSAMFETLVERRFGGSLHTEDELLFLQQALAVLDINLLDKKVYNTASSRASGNDIEARVMTQQWPAVVGEHYQRLASQLRGAELEELKAARDILLRNNSTSGLNSLLQRAQYENFYRVLGLDPAVNHSEERITQVYRKLVKRYHTDKNKTEEAAEKMTEITAAGKLLRDKATRSRIDAFLRQYLQQGEGS